MTKKERVLDYLKTHKSGITPLQAIDLFGATRLSAIIFDLKNRDGYKIITNTVEVKDRYGKSCYVAKYVLVEE